MHGYSWRTTPNSWRSQRSDQGLRGSSVGHPDLRGHQPDPAGGHRQGAPGVAVGPVQGSLRASHGSRGEPASETPGLYEEWFRVRIAARRFRPMRGGSRRLRAGSRRPGPERRSRARPSSGIRGVPPDTGFTVVRRHTRRIELFAEFRVGAQVSVVHARVGTPCGLKVRRATPTCRRILQQIRMRDCVRSWSAGTCRGIASPEPAALGEGPTSAAGTTSSCHPS